MEQQLGLFLPAPPGRLPRSIDRSPTDFCTALVRADPSLQLEGELGPRPPPANKGMHLPAEVFTPDEIARLLAACDTRTDADIRNRALLALLWRSGLRISEALAMHVEDLDLECGTVYVRKAGKGGCRRTAVFRSFDLVDDIHRWLERRTLAKIGDDAPLFCSTFGTPLDPSYFRHFLPRLAKRAGFDRRVHCHAFRHSHAADLCRTGVPEVIIQRQLGHESLWTTSIYLTNIGVRTAECIEAIRGPQATEPASQLIGS